MDVIIVCNFQYFGLAGALLQSINHVGVVVSPVMLTCPLPTVTLFDGYVSTQQYTVTISVTNLGGVFSNSVSLILDPLITPTPVHPQPDYSDVARYYATCMSSNVSAASDGLNDLNRWFFLPALSTARLSMDFAHLPQSFKYDEHFRVAIFVNQSVCLEERCSSALNEYSMQRSPCTTPLPYSHWYADSTVDKHRIVNVTLYALEDVIFHVEAHIMYGLFLPFANFLRNTTTVEVFSPSRANVTVGVGSRAVRVLDPTMSNQQRRVDEVYTFAALFLQDWLAFEAPPLNLPPRFQELQTGRILAGMNVSESYPITADFPWIVPPTSEVHPSPTYWDAPKLTISIDDAVALYREIFQEVTPDANGGVYAFTRMVLPYMPFLSNCRGFDRYMPLFSLLEDTACGLRGGAPAARRAYPTFPDQDDIKPVGPFDFFANPISDECYRKVSCRYEEDLTTTDVNLRWFEQPEATAIFQFIRRPITLEEFYANAATIDAVTISDGLDAFINVVVTRAAASELRGTCDIQCFPRQITLTLTYYQVRGDCKRRG